MFLNGEEQLHIGASTDSRLTALVSDSNGETRFRLRNNRWESIAGEDAPRQIIAPDADLDIDEPTNWVERDNAERTDREERIDGLRLAQQYCDNATNPSLRRTLQAFIETEQQTLNDKIYAPEF